MYVICLLNICTLGIVGRAQLVDVAQLRVGAHGQVVLVAVLVGAREQRHVALRVPPQARRRAVHAARHAHAQRAEMYTCYNDRDIGGFTSNYCSRRVLLTVSEKKFTWRAFRCRFVLRNPR